MLRLNPNAPLPSVLLQRALRLFGPNGERWTKGRFKRYPNKKYPKGAFCSIGAVQEINTRNQSLATQYLNSAANSMPRNTFGGTVHYNDAPQRRFSQIKVMFKKAIALAKEKGH